MYIKKSKLTKDWLIIGIYPDNTPEIASIDDSYQNSKSQLNAFKRNGLVIDRDPKYQPNGSFWRKHFV